MGIGLVLRAVDGESLEILYLRPGASEHERTVIHLSTTYMQH